MTAFSLVLCVSPHTKFMKMKIILLWLPIKNINQYFLIIFNTFNPGIKTNYMQLYFTGRRKWGHTHAFCSTSSQVTYGYRYLAQLILYYSSTVRSLWDMELLIIGIQTWQRIWIVSAHLLKCKWYPNLEAKNLIMHTFNMWTTLSKQISTKVQTNQFMTYLP